MTIRSRLPWPLRWAAAALVLGFCGAVALWAFEFGKDIAGLDRGSRQELARLRGENEDLRRQRDHAQADHDISGSLVTAERAAQERLASRVKALEAENRSLREDLAFFEHLMPAGAAGIAIRGLRAEVLDGARLKWQVLVVQPAKDAPEFRGRLELSMTGTLDGQPWSHDGAQPLRFRHYGRAEGAIAVPQQAVVKNVTAKVVEGTVTRAVQTIKL